MPSKTQFFVALAGTVVCLLGFARWPRASYDLLRARFVVPAIVWFGSFYQVIWRYAGGAGDRAGGFGHYRVAFGTGALGFVVGCVAFFWVGYLPRIGRLAAGKLRRYGTVRVPGMGDSMLFWSACLAAVCLAVTLVVDGYARLVASPAGLRGAGIGFSSLPRVINLLSSRVEILLIVLGAAALGFGLGAKRNKGAATYALAAVLFLALDLKFLDYFSRGVGLPMVVALFTYACQARRLPRVATVATALWTVVGMATSLAARGAFRVRSAYNWFLALFHQALLIAQGHFGHVLVGFDRLIDTITPLSVVMAGVHAHVYMGQLTIPNWFLFQLPVPHFILAGPRWTFDPTRFVGGRGAWGYTAGVFGDLFGHFGWWGMAIFAAVGMASRFADELAGWDGALAPETLNVFALQVPIVYIALCLAGFLDFRGWVSMAFFGFYALCAAAWAARNLLGLAGPGGLAPATRVAPRDGPSGGRGRARPPNGGRAPPGAGYSGGAGHAR